MLSLIVPMETRTILASSLGYSHRLDQAVWFPEAGTEVVRGSASLIRQVAGIEQAIVDEGLRMLNAQGGPESTLRRITGLTGELPMPCLPSIIDGFTARRLRRPSGGIFRLDQRCSVPIGKRTSDNGGHVRRKSVSTFTAEFLHVPGFITVPALPWR